jgi:hypothetical protein
MAIISKQKNQSAEYNILYEILRQLEQLTKVMGSVITTTTTTTT